MNSCQSRSMCLGGTSSTAKASVGPRPIKEDLIEQDPAKCLQGQCLGHAQCPLLFGGILLDSGVNCQMAAPESLLSSSCSTGAAPRQSSPNAYASHAYSKATSGPFRVCIKTTRPIKGICEIAFYSPTVGQRIEVSLMLQTNNKSSWKDGELKLE